MIEHLSDLLVSLGVRLGVDLEPAIDIARLEVKFVSEALVVGHGREYGSEDCSSVDGSLLTHLLELLTHIE